MKFVQYWAMGAVSLAWKERNVQWRAASFSMKFTHARLHGVPIWYTQNTNNRWARNVQTRLDISGARVVLRLLENRRRSIAADTGEVVVADDEDSCCVEEEEGAGTWIEGAEELAL